MALKKPKAHRTPLDDNAAAAFVNEATPARPAQPENKGSGKPEQQQTIQQESNKATSSASNSSFQQENHVYGEEPHNQTMPPDNNKTAKQPYQKATFSLREDILLELDDAWMTLRRNPPPGAGRITKTAIVEAALEIMLEDLKSRRQESLLAIKLADK